MAEKDWAAILKDEDRIIANSDRRFRYHCYSLESMSAVSYTHLAMMASEFRKMPRTLQALR